MFFRKRVLVAALVLVGLWPATLAARTNTAPRHNCDHTYTIHEFTVYVNRAYRKTRHPTHREWRVMRHMIACPARPWDPKWDRWHWRKAREHNEARRQAASNPFNTGLASWYDDSGATASGFHSYYGVAACGSAGPCFPFGTKIEFCYPVGSSRCVTAVVDDHGPYAGGRNFDLNQNTASAISFTGVDDVSWRVVR